MAKEREPAPSESPRAEETTARRADVAPPPARLVHRVISRLNVGGPAMHVVNLTRAMEREGWRTRLLAGHIYESEGDMAYYAEQRDVDVTYVDTMSRAIRPLRDLRSLWTLYRRFRRERPSVVHTHAAKAGTVGRLAARLAGVPAVIHTYHGHVLGGGYFSPAKTRVFLGIERVLGRLTARLVVLSRRQADEMADELRVASREKFSVVPLGLELEDFVRAEPADLRSSGRSALGVGAEEIVLGIVGRVVPIKNHRLYLDVVQALVEAAPRPVRGMVVGGGELESELRDEARRRGLDRRVLWLGWRRDLPELYPAMDVMLLTSHDEGTPVAVIEALCSGTPVVARDVGGVGEILREAGAGALVPRDAPVGEWVAAVLAALEAGQASDAVRRSVAERFSVQRLASDLAGLYRQVLERS